MCCMELEIGIIVARGSFTGDTKTPALCVRSEDERLLHLLHEAFGGKVYGPYKGVYAWMLRGSDLQGALPIIREHMPECNKRDTLISWIKSYGL